MALFDRFRSEKRASSNPTLAELLAVQRGGGFNYTREAVNDQTAFAVSSVFACVSIIADSIASMPWGTFREIGDRREALETPSVLVRPNPDQLKYQFVSQVIMSMALHGNAYIAYSLDQRAMPAELRVLDPMAVRAERDKTTKRITFKIGDANFDSSTLLHLPWLTLPGQILGLSPMEANRGNIGLALAMSRHLQQFYGEGGIPSSVLETDANLTTEQRDEMSKGWADFHAQSRRTAVLSGGLKWRPVVASAADSQMLETREQLVHDIARIYRVPAHLINAKGDGQTYQNQEAAGINFVRHTLLPWMQKLEQGLSSILPGKQTVRFNADAYLRSETLTRYQSYQLAIANGILSRNEVRSLENREPYEGGDEMLYAAGGIPEVKGEDAEPPQ